MKFFSLFLVLIASNSFAQSYLSGTSYVGKETVNQQLTGNSCKVLIGQVQSINNATNCFDLNYSFGSPSIVKNNLNLNSAFTKVESDRKTCAVNLDGSITGDEIFNAESDSVYTRLYSGMLKEGHTQYDYFLKISPDSRLPQEAAIHSMSFFSEKLVECVDLQLQ